MDCNKDEAQRAKQVAENKMQNGDFVGALKFALKAQKLFPETHNITLILTVCQVHCAAHKKLSESDMDWYRILLTERFSDETTIKDQYMKLWLLLHPFTNKSAGAEAAFKLIGEAYGVLSDRTKRYVYDMKIRVLVGTPAPKVPHSSFVVTQQTFWTSCHHCNAKYQYYKSILNANVRCQRCSKYFTARQMAKCTTADSASYRVRKSKDGHETAGATKGASEATKAGVGTSSHATSKAKESKTPTNVGNKRAVKVEENGVDPSGFGVGVHCRRSSRIKQNVSYTKTARDGDFQSSSKRPRQEESKEASDLEKQNSDAASDSEFDPEAFSSKFLEDPAGAMDSFLTKISTPSQSHSSIPEPNTSEIANSIVADMQKELRSILISDNLVELLQQGQDPTIQLSSVYSKLHLQEGKIPQDQLTDIQTALVLADDVLSCFKHLEMQQDNKAELEKEVVSRANRLRDITSEVTQEKEAKEKAESDLIMANSRIRKLEEELQNATANRDLLLSNISERKTKLKAKGEVATKEVQLMVQDRRKLGKVENEVAMAKAAFEKHEKKYQAFRENPPF